MSVNRAQVNNPHDNDGIMYFELVNSSGTSAVLTRVLLLVLAAASTKQTPSGLTTCYCLSMALRS